MPDERSRPQFESWKVTRADGTVEEGKGMHPLLRDGDRVEIVTKEQW